VNRSHLFQGDDDNDSKLFRKAEEYVLKHCPNPDRIGCPGPAVLRAFVEAPKQTELADICGLHILRCAECTRDLIKLRREREERLPRSAKATRSRQWRAVPLLLGLVSALIGIVALLWFLHWT